MTTSKVEKPVLVFSFFLFTVSVASIVIGRQGTNQNLVSFIFMAVLVVNVSISAAPAAVDCLTQFFVYFSLLFSIETDGNFLSGNGFLRNHLTN